MNTADRGAVSFRFIQNEFDLTIGDELTKFESDNVRGTICMHFIPFNPLESYRPTLFVYGNIDE